MQGGEETWTTNRKKGKELAIRKFKFFSHIFVISTIKVVPSSY